MPDLKIQTCNESLESEALSLRKEIIKAFYECGGGHYGGALSVLDIVLTLHRRVLRISPAAPHHPLRDRFILSKGHAAMAYYAVLRKLGFVDAALETYGRYGSPYEGHPDMQRIPGIDFSTGSLGQGLSIGLGMAFALRGSGACVWVVLGDGECQEGQVWESAMLAHRYRVDNLYSVVDCNGNQEWGWNYDKTLETAPILQIRDKWEAFGWRVFEVNGHDHEDMSRVFAEVSSVRNQPSVVIAHTVKGKGFPMMEANPGRFHCTQINLQEQMELDKIL